MEKCGYVVLIFSRSYYVSRMSTGQFILLFLLLYIYYFPSLSEGAGNQSEYIVGNLPHGIFAKFWVGQRAFFAAVLCTGEEVNTLITLARRAADPLHSGPCKVTNLREVA